MTEKVFIPWSPSPTGRSLEYAEVTFSVSGIVACTEGFDCAIQLVTADMAPSGEGKFLWLTQTCGTFSDGDLALEIAGAGDSATLASWGALDADMVVINSKNKSIVGINYTIGLNAETASVPLCNYAELTCSDIDNFSPQQHIVNFGANGALGTVINAINEVASPYRPFIFDGLPNDKVKVGIADINSLTGLTAGDGQLGLVFK